MQPSVPVQYLRRSATCGKKKKKKKVILSLVCGIGSEGMDGDGGWMVKYKLPQKKGNWSYLGVGVGR